MKTYRIASTPGDGIGPEVITAGVEVLQAVAAREGRFALEVRTFPWGADHYRAHGVMMPEDGVDTLRGFDAIYFGRSEEHTSELQSLMRISYAVSCLKKKTPKLNNLINKHTTTLIHSSNNRLLIHHHISTRFNQ